MQIVSSRSAHAIGEVDRGDGHAPAGAPGGGLGHDAEADARFHHPADRIEAAQLDAQAQRAADAARLVGEEALQRARAVEPDEVVVEHLGEGDRRRAPASGWPCGTTRTKRSLRKG